MTAAAAVRVGAPVGWQHRAACAAPGVDPELFFPTPGQHGKAARAKRICDRCPVKAPCLADALATPPSEDHGIRAGTTPQERRQLRRGRTAGALR
jgi:WhiB family transcriptional regulator, redox-sensing transcriptional regulator